MRQADDSASDTGSTGNGLERFARPLGTLLPILAVSTAIRRRDPQSLCHHSRKRAIFQIRHLVVPLREDDQVTPKDGSMLVPQSSTQVLARAQSFPRLRYMGSKYRLLPHLERVFAQLGGHTAVDAFSGSGVVSYLLKAQGFQVTSNDFLNFPTAIARATVANSDTRLSPTLVDEICGQPADDRDFIQRTFEGLYFTPEDLRFLDSAWSNIDRLTGYERDLAVSALVPAGHCRLQLLRRR